MEMRITHTPYSKWIPGTILLCLQLVFSLAVFGQQKSSLILKGHIKLPDGLQLQVSVGSPKNGYTNSDSAGNFSIPVRVIPDTLKFSAVGLKTQYEVIKTPLSFLNITMETATQMLNEVVINTGYQQVRANEINGSVSQINETMFNARPGTNILNRLLGQSTGLLLNIGKSNGNPQNTTNLSIRGLGTINGPLDPLIVLDGFIYEGDISNINPLDVESVSLLKDAAAASIWGSRAGNGVIVISTKKGRYNQPLAIGFNANVIVQQLPNLYALNQMSSADYIDVERKMFNAGYFDDQINNSPYQALSPAVEVMLAQRSGKISGSVANAQLDALSKQDSRSAYLKEFYTHAITQQYGLNVRGGGSNYKFLLSGAYDKVLSETYAKNNKFNIGLTQEFRAGKNLTLSGRVYFTSLETASGRPAYNSLSVGGRILPYLSFRDAQGNALPLASAYRGAYTDTAGNGKLLDWKYYPADDYLHNMVNTNRWDIFASTGLKYHLTSFLNFDLSYQYQRQYDETVSLSDAQSYQARNLINTYTQLNPTTGILTYPVPLGGIQTLSLGNVSSSTARGQFNLNKTLGQHSLTAIAGAETRSAKTDGKSAAWYGYNGDPLTYSNIDLVNAYPEFLTGNYSQVGSGNNLTATQYRFVSLYANAAYSFKKRYTLSGSARRDGSNIFGANTNDRWKPLWSTGLGWLLSGEPFYRLDWLPELRIKATYGTSGNVDLTRTALPVASYATNNVTGLPITRISSINNPDLKWEQLSQWNIGMDFTLKDRRLQGSVSYFVKHGTNLYGPALYDYTTWGGSQELIRNIAEMKGYGVETELHALNLQRSSFRWQADIYFNFNMSKTVTYNNSYTTGLYNILASGTSITPLVGKPLYAIAVYKWAGLDAAGNPRGYLNGKPSIDYTAMALEASSSGDNLLYVGSATPTYYGNLINSFFWKGFSLSFNMSYRLGYYTIKPTINYSRLIANGTGNSDYALRWQKAGDEALTTVPAFVYPANQDRDYFYTASQPNVIKADNIRLDYINLGYRLDLSKMKLPFRSVDLYANMQNVGIIWRANHLGLDPDYLNTLSPVRSLTFGLRSNF
ncbi:SusC/RagA family TonB-linked outer membrane protein [Mucilaginibacter sp. OK283]|uniref:SusC/RagA family TonB-linked outer membrane protein n=1 Tax=Mucilaginibacter sp. OK283 TaxID=1881049 RepID=UPI0008AACAF1|nr:TonB-linked outer membrane protein, SusC/RagA family [Mucilaginibacter sp. OK283]